MGRNGSRQLVQKIGETLTTEPTSIKEISEELSSDRKAVTAYLEALSEGGLIKEEKVGRQRLFWKPVLSDRQTGLELRGTAYEISQAMQHLEEAAEKNGKLIEKSADDYQLQNLDSKTTEGDSSE